MTPLANRGKMPGKMALCDYCGTSLGCTNSSLLFKGYCQTKIGLLVCDECLLRNSDEFPGRRDRVLALRLLHVRGVNIEAVEAKVCHASGKIAPEQIHKLTDAIANAGLLFREGELLAALEAGQAAWNVANYLYGALEARPEVLAGRGAIRQRKAAGFSSGRERESERRPIWAKWQAEVDKVRSEQPNLSKSRVFEIAGAVFGVTRPAVAKRVKWR